MTDPDLDYDDPLDGDNAAILFSEEGMTFIPPNGVSMEDEDLSDHVLMAGALFEYVVRNQAWLMTLAFGPPMKSKLH